MLLLQMLLAAEADERRELLRIAAEAAGGQAALGRALGAKDGAFVGQMLRGERAITEKTLRALSSVKAFEARARELGLLSKAPSPNSAPPAPATNFADRHEVSESDWALLQDIRIAMESPKLAQQLEEIRKEASALAVIAERIARRGSP